MNFSAIISRNKELFLKHLLKFMYVMPAVSICFYFLNTLKDIKSLKFQISIVNNILKVNFSSAF